MDVSTQWLGLAVVFLAIAQGMLWVSFLRHTFRKGHDED